MFTALIFGLKATLRSIAASRSSLAETLPELTSSAWPTPSMNLVSRARSDNDMKTVLSISMYRAKTE
jgi:hypothetical protein